MELSIAILAGATGYLIGSISFARVVTARMAPGENIEETKIQLADAEGEYRTATIGANTAAGALGARTGGMVAMLDILKVLLPTLAFRLLFPQDPYFLIAALAGMAGHIWPLYYRFRGGAGYSAALGGLLVVDPLAAVVTPILGWFLGLVILRSILVATLSWMWLLIPWMWFRTHDMAYVWYAVTLNILFILAMIPQIKQAWKYYREGKLINYGKGYLQSNPMGRGMLKMAERFNLTFRW